MPLEAPTAEAISRQVYRHARAIVERADPVGDNLADAQAICSAIEEHGQRLDREAERIGQRAAERAASYIEDELSPFPDGPSFADGMREVLDELGRAGLVDEIAGASTLDDACRRLRRAAGDPYR